MTPLEGIILEHVFEGDRQFIPQKATLQREE